MFADLRLAWKDRVRFRAADSWLAAGDPARALAAAGAECAPALARTGLALTVLELAERHPRRCPREAAEARWTLGAGTPDADLFPWPLTHAWRARLARAAALWDRQAALDLLPPDMAQARAACLLAAGRLDDARDVIDGLDAQIEAQAVRLDLAAARGDAASWRAALSALFAAGELTPPALTGAHGEIGLQTLDVDGAAPFDDGDDLLVSVVMPARDAAATVALAVRSILRQTHRRLELILVDDASVDDTLARARDAAGGDARLRVLRRAVAGGPSAARNDGLRAAAGAVIAFNDADDWSHPERFSRTVARLGGAARAGRAQAHVSDMLRMDRAGRVSPPRVFPLARLNVSSLAMTRACFETIGMQEEQPFGADSEYLARVTTYLGAAALLRDKAPLVVAGLRLGSVSIGSRFGFDRPEGARARVAYRENWLPRHVAHVLGRA